MPVINDELFTIKTISHHDNSIRAILDINKDCTIFNGHFPGQPVVPGACMLQIMKDVLEKALNARLQLKNADHLKFIAMVDPANTHSVILDISYKFVDECSMNITAKLTDDRVVFFKFQGSFIRRLL